MTDFESWQGKISAQGQTLKSLEHPVEGTSATYPLLCNTETTTSAEPSSARAWGIRVVLTESLGESKMKALSEAVEEVQVAPPDEPVRTLPSLCQAEIRGQEGRVSVDLAMLRNVAEVQRLKSAHTEVETWTLVTLGTPNDDPEHLVGETIRQLTGVLSGCRFLEIRQAPGESFQSLWGRVNVSRLMASESELQDLESPVVGASFFEELQGRLS